MLLLLAPTFHNKLPALADQTAMLQIAIGRQICEDELQYFVGQDVEGDSGRSALGKVCCCCCCRCDIVTAITQIAIARGHCVWRPVLASFVVLHLQVQLRA